MYVYIYLATDIVICMFRIVKIKKKKNMDDNNSACVYKLDCL